MKKTPICVLFLILGQIVVGQKISKQVIGASGTNLTNNNYRLSWTIGEPVVGLMTKDDTQLGNGYHPSMNMQTLSTEDVSIAAGLKVYPNPTTHYLYTEQKDNHPLDINIFDLTGKNVMNLRSKNNQAIDVSGLSEGVYMVEIKDSQTMKRNTYKIIKTQ